MGIWCPLIFYAQYGIPISYFLYIFLGINPHSEIEQKRSDLLKQCTNFSYTEVVKKSKKKIMENCT